tara:strand:- start:21083 stop:21919 length:837 start_codon:yes stop_codon:yes gene_type:complete
MKTQFVIRDDDLCFFTNHDELYKLYSDIWDHYPITFAAVPWQKGTFAGHIPLKYWHTNKSFPIGENKDLIEFLNLYKNKGNLDIVLHGINHTYNKVGLKFIPELVDYNDDFKSSIAEAKTYLDKLFNTDINIFVPPSNTIRKDLAKILINGGWSLLNYPGLKRNTRSLLSIEHQYMRIARLIHLLVHKVDMTSPLTWDDRWELGGHPLTPSTDIHLLKKAFLMSYERGDPFVLATHYWEHNCVIPTSVLSTQYDLLLEFLEFVSKYDVVPALASNLVL